MAIYVIKKEATLTIIVVTEVSSVGICFVLSLMACICSDGFAVPVIFLINVFFTQLVLSCVTVQRCLNQLDNKSIGATRLLHSRKHTVLKNQY